MLGSASGSRSIASSSMSAHARDDARDLIEIDRRAPAFHDDAEVEAGAARPVARGAIALAFARRACSRARS